MKRKKLINVIFVEIDINKISIRAYFHLKLYIINLIKVLYISDGCCTEFNIYYFILYLF